MNYPLSSPLAVSIAHGYDLLRLMARSSLGACAFVDEVIRYHWPRVGDAEEEGQDAATVSQVMMLMMLGMGSGGGGGIWSGGVEGGHDLRRFSSVLFSCEWFVCCQLGRITDREMSVLEEGASERLFSN